MLTARLAVHGGLYVIERVKRGIYSLSRLAPWVQDGDVVVAAKGWQGTRATQMDVEADEAARSVPDALNWWQAAQIDEPSSDLGLGDEFAGLQVDVIFGPSDGETAHEEPAIVGSLDNCSQSFALASKSFNTEVGSSFGGLESQDVRGPEAMDVDFNEANGPDATQTPEELLSGMRDQYLQALYVSKVRASRRDGCSVLTIASRRLWRILLKVH